MPIPPVPVFQGITEQEWAQMAAACPMARRLYEKGQTIFRQGEPAREMGVVLSGAVHIESVDLWGHRTILSHVGPSQVFGETYALTGGPLLVDAVAAEVGDLVEYGKTETLFSTPKDKRTEDYITGRFG